MLLLETLFAGSLHPINRLLFDVQVVLLPGPETAFHFHHGIALACKDDARIGG